MIDNLSYYYYNIGLERARKRDITHAIDALSVAVALKEDNIAAWNLLGLCHYRIGKLPTAEYCWMVSLYSSNDNNVIQSNVIQSNVVLDNVTSGNALPNVAIPDNAESDSFVPDNAASGDVTTDNIAKDNIASDYLRYVKEDIKFIEDRITEIKTLVAEKKYKKASRVMERGFLKNSRQKNNRFILKNNNDFKIDNNVKLLNYIGILYMLSGKRRKALRSWEKATSLDTSNPDALKYILHACNAYNR